MDNVYAISEIVGSSTIGIDDAIRTAVSTASRSLNHLEWFEVGQIRGHIADGVVAHFQVTVRLGFRYESEKIPASPATDRTLEQAIAELT